MALLAAWGTGHTVLVIIAIIILVVLIVLMSTRKPGPETPSGQPGPEQETSEDGKETQPPTYNPPADEQGQQ